MAACDAGHRVPAGGSARPGPARRALSLAALAAALAACGSSIPPVPEEFRRLQEREASCAACHDTGRAPPLAPGATVTPSGHPSFMSADLVRPFRTP